LTKNLYQAEELKSENIKTATAETVPVFPEYKNGKVIRKPMKSGKQENEKKEAVYNKVADGMEVEENNTEAEVEAKTVSEAKVEAKTVSEAKVEAKTVSEANVEAKTVSEANVEEILGLHFFDLPLIYFSFFLKDWLLKPIQEFFRLQLT